MVWSRLSETLYFFRQHLLALLWLLLPVLVPVSLFLNHRFYVTQGGEPEKAMADGMAIGLQMVASLYANALVIRYTLSTLSDSPVAGYGRLWQEALGRVPALFVAQVLAGLMIILGLMFFVLPGIWLSGVLMPAYVLVVAESLSGIDALKSAWARFRSAAWQIAASQLALLAGLLMVLGGLAMIEQGLEGQDVTLRWLTGSVLDVIGLMCAQTVCILLVRFYDLERNAANVNQREG